MRIIKSRNTFAFALLLAVCVVALFAFRGIVNRDSSQFKNNLNEFQGKQISLLINKFPKAAMLSDAELSTWRKSGGISVTPPPKSLHETVYLIQKGYDLAFIYTENGVILKIVYAET